MKLHFRLAVLAFSLAAAFATMPSRAQDRGSHHAGHAQAQPAKPAATQAGKPACSCCSNGKCPLPAKHDMAGMQHGAPKPAKGFDAAMDAAMAKMHADMMAVKPTGNPDVDFMRGMLPHHEGAVAMAEILREYGRDPETRELATNIIRTQQSEIHLMKRWLVKRGYGQYNN